MGKRVQVILSFLAFLVGTIFTSGAVLSAQESQVDPENPPFPIEVEVSTAQHLNFGTFIVNTFQSRISVDHSGSRTSDSNIQELNFGTPSAALFLVTANPGTIISIRTPTNVDLTNGNGKVISLELDSFNPGQTFIMNSKEMEVFVGGTLIIPANTGNMEGTYGGNYTLDFIHQ